MTSTRFTARHRAVLVPLDGSDYSERALGPAEWLAQRFDAEIHVVSAHVPRVERLWYEHYLEDISARIAGTTAHCLDVPDVARAILGVAAELDPCVVCIATHGRSRSAAVLGSTFAALAQISSIPLVAVGPQAVPHTAPDPRRIVACVDQTASATPTIELAASWARALFSTLSIVTVTAHDDQKLDDELQRLAKLPELDDLKVDASVLIGPGGPHAELARHLGHKPASLVVAATHARGRLATALVGSEAARIIHDSSVPVLAHSIQAE